MLLKLNQIIAFSLGAFFIALILYPLFIQLLKKLKAGKTLRINAVTGEAAKIFQKLHAHKAGTPTMGGGMFLFVMAVMIALSLWFQKMGWINNALFNREETYIILFGFFSMGLIGLLDDFFNIKNIGSVKGLSARTKLIGMFLFSAFISRWFYVKLNVDFINLWPIAGEIHLGIWYPIITFIVTIAIVNAINFTDGLDGLAGGLMTMILFILGIVTFSLQTYIATTVICIMICLLLAFLWFNIHPAKVFMGDSGAFAIGGLLAGLLYLLNMRIGIFIPFVILFGYFIVELLSSAGQITWKKLFKKKLFAMSPMHHYFEHKGHKETTIVMKSRLVQGVLSAITAILIFYQIHTLS